MADREEDVFMAKLAEQAERYEEMVEYMKKVANAGINLCNEERNLLSVAYKNVIGSRRASWRIVSNLEQKEKSAAEEDKEKLVVMKEFREKIEEELKGICNDILQLLEDRLIVADTSKLDDTSAESQVFYMKMKGDYKRYIAEFSSADEHESAKEESLAAYTKATELATEHLNPTHPIRLGLALNFSVFYYEIVAQPAEACKLAKAVFEEAIADLDGLTDNNYKDSTLILQLLRDNLTLWNSGIEEKEQGKGEGELQDVENEN